MRIPRFDLESIRRGATVRTRAAVTLGLVAAVALAAAALLVRDGGRPGAPEKELTAPTRDAIAGVVGGVAPSAPAGLALKAPEESLRAAPAPAAKPDVASDGAPGSPPPPSLDDGRTIIRTGAVDLEVRAVADAFERVRQVATLAGGFVSDSNFSGKGETQVAYLTLRVPSDRFGDVITQLRGLAEEVRSISTNARDVTEEVTDLEATLRNLRAVEARYVDLLGRAASIGEVLQVQDRLNQVRLQIDRTEARRQLRQAQSELSSIVVALRPLPAATKAATPTGPLAEARAAWQSSLETLEGIATFALVAAVYSWWLLPPAGAALAWWRLRRRHAADAGAPGVPSA